MVTHNWQFITAVGWKTCKRSENILMNTQTAILYLLFAVGSYAQLRNALASIHNFPIVW